MRIASGHILVPLILALVLTACEKTPQQARRELVDSGYSYARRSFAECVAKADSTGLELFLMAGMDPNMTTSGYTMLEHAGGDSLMVAMLLRAGADPDSGGVSTPLIEAIRQGGGRAVPMLLAAGADADQTNTTGLTPLMAAADQGDLGSMRLLLTAGATVNARSKLGVTPLSLARRQEHESAIEMLQQAGARDDGGPDLQALMNPEHLDAQAPQHYEVTFQTSAGAFRVEVIRAWAPQGADRFYNLVTHGFFDEQRFFRVMRDKLVQFGLHGRPEVAGRWYEATIQDDPVTQTNARGTISFASGGQPHSRSTQVFINLADNADLDPAGLAPFGRVVEGLESLDDVHAGYGELPDQARILAEGNSYLASDFARLDSILQARLVP